jgi:hypothetical protein
VVNKVLSTCIAFSLAFVTLSFKRTTYIFYNQELDKSNGNISDSSFESNADLNAAYHIMLIYWMLFIYLSLSGMDELIEMFSVMNQLEKGALGLFFELNYFIGVGLSIYILWFSF